MITCNLCPRECHANILNSNNIARHNTDSYCKKSSAFSIGAICKHHGEEPVISGRNGICNVFFTHCNLQCLYCQNHQISGNNSINQQYELDFEEVIIRINNILDSGCNMLGFVSPSHCIPQIKTIITAIHKQGKSPTIVYNSNAYDKVETLKSLEGLIDIYLPDFKYADAKLAKELSDVINYPEIALYAIKEMIRQKGTSLYINDDGLAEKGVIIRHLVLPNYVENSKKVLQLIADNISTDVPISLMSQYYPTDAVKNHSQLGRSVTKKEYAEVVEEMERLGFYRGWVQEYSSKDFYLPDFNRDGVFE